MTKIEIIEEVSRLYDILGYHKKFRVKWGGLINSNIPELLELVERLQLEYGMRKTIMDEIEFYKKELKRVELKLEQSIQRKKELSEGHLFIKSYDILIAERLFAVDELKMKIKIREKHAEGWKAK